MAVKFNPAALDMFRNAQLAGENSVANLDGKGGLKANGTFHGGNIFRTIGRSGDERRANNEVRTELLKSLGQAFNLSGVREASGKVTFSKDFMTMLEKLLGGDVLKTGDFDIDANGAVSSGRPLTARRIRAIISRAEEVGKTESDEGSTSAVLGKGVAEKTDKLTAAEKTVKTAGARGIGPVKTGFGLRKEIYNPLFGKLDTIKARITNAPKHVQKFYARVEKSLNYLANELDVDRMKDGAPDKSALRNDQAYEFNVLELGEEYKEGMNKFQYYDPKQGKYVSLKSTSDFSRDILWHAIGGGLLHLERATRINESGKKVPFSPGEAPDIAPLRKYIADTLRLFVTKAIDLFDASEDAGKLDTFFEHLKDPGACIEDQGLHFVEFEARHLTDKSDAPSAEDAERLELIADGKPADLPKGAVDQFMDIVIDIEEEEWFSQENGWNKKTADAFKVALRGKSCVMQDFDAPHELGKKVPELMGENGLPVVKVLTDELIDEIGPKVLREYFRI
ncbi:MAG: hypothetical protein IJM72_06640 [Deltaproteobacteria bacterium]|nr:hypothetical protein [Deltaproteobacteria bacterium]